jgi:dihydrofolate synthase/folylpolyglutamate synthase
MPIETYAQALDFWFSRINYEQRGMPGDLRALKLDRMRWLLEHLGNPHLGYPIIHITGTKGKGSTAAMLDRILRAAGYRTGLFTSPHLVQVEERVQVDGRPISPADLTVHMQRVEQATHAVEARGEAPTFFEIMTALGFLYFKAQAVQAAVVEVGLGGRFDATNVCEPAVSVITSISFDHMEQLGHTLAAIAGEKSGIIKPGRPVVSGVVEAEPRAVIAARAQELAAPLWELGREFNFDYHPGDVARDQRPLVRLRMDKTGPWHELALWGDHQGANAAVALAVVARLRRDGWSIPDQALDVGLRSVVWPARLEILARDPWIILDCAHNDASIQMLVRWLTERLPPCRRTLLFAASRDKDLERILPWLTPHFHAAVMTRYSSSARGADPHDLAQRWLAAGGRTVSVEGSPAAAWSTLVPRLAPGDLLCVTGSVFLAGEIRALAVP